MQIERIKPGPGQESVWDYPRPPRVEDCERAIRVLAGGQVLVETRRSKRVLETSHPPVYYIAAHDICGGTLVPLAKRSHCEWKGKALYFDVCIGDRVIREAAWGYLVPRHGFESLRNHVAFYPHLMDACFVDDEQVQPQAGDFYGGWITKDIVGPFKGEPGTMGW